ncbi:leucyl aminopeptidase [Spongiibacter taiwanensis]|uniref:leucyl aminopeptidase n=1 Tax=Spongiibacter taiwanensis TaxID=1748242 RepID=UPI0020354670|nr:leucyl aminopeptidase [Spongiibacter taiwanensis]USA42912.1 leucyl aminopeptidase [Spongiibacter taiwanensis]
MQISLKNVKNIATTASDCLIMTVNPSLSGPLAQQLDSACGGAIGKILKVGDFQGKLAETVMLPICDGVKATRIMLVGTGDAPLTVSDYDKIIKATVTALNRTRCKSALWCAENLAISDRADTWVLQRLAQQMTLASYQYRKTLSNPKPGMSLQRLSVAAPVTAANKAAIAAGSAIGEGTNLARELGNLPANICTPTYLAEQAQALNKKYPALKVTVLEEKKMQQLGMGALLSVSAGSDQPAKLIVMEYTGTTKSTAPHVLVGKGITFDTGGISLKPGAKMDEMKFDMCGAASVFGTMETICQLGPKVNVVGIVAASENMPSGRATKPGDVVTSMSGQTIEILNTDAEGRLVLCDALTFAAKFKPASIIDIATLTGACVVALGKHAAGLFSNSDDFAQELLSAGQAAQDRAWHMPLWDDYQTQLDSNFADMANIGGPEAGSVTAACFLSRFTKDQRWAHLDIAGAAWDGGAAKGATGRPVALLSQYLLSKAGQ